MAPDGQGTSCVSKVSKLGERGLPLYFFLILNLDVWFGNNVSFSSYEIGFVFQAGEKQLKVLIKISYSIKFCAR